MNIKFNIESLVRDNVKRLKPYSSARDEFKDFTQEMVYLDANENPFENGVNRYPDPQQRTLKSVLAGQKGVTLENILLGNGSDEVLDLLFRAFCEPGKDNVITLPPTYGMYGVLAAINNVENREVLLDESFQPRIGQTLNTADKNSKLLFICSPNNPSGNAFSVEKIEELITSFKGLVVIDEAYIDFSNQPSWTNRLQEFPNLVICQTLSKAYGMAGIRLGICIASEGIISIVNKIKPPYNVNQLTQAKALERVLKIEEVNTEVTSILKAREALLKVLVEVPFVKKIYPTDANFVLIKVDDANLRYKQMLDKGVVLRNRSSQPLCESTLRITIGTKKENETLIEVLKTLN